MCGICGIVYPDRTQTLDESVLAAMTHTLRFRGPDGQGFYSGLGVGFGHRRLGVIDLEGGHQPMSDPQRQVTICYNGEIYNYRELRDELKTLGHSFRTRSDTEVLLNGYRQWGLDLMPRLVGMFAFAVWDARSETLVLCRDRLGVKPLYWATFEDRALVFGSTLDSILANPRVPRRLNRELFRNYVSLGYVAGEESILHGIHRLPPGNLLILKRGEDPVLKCWWDLADIWQNKATDKRSHSDIRAEFTDLLSQAVRDRLVSDVPLGAFLSGGLDSSTITALMKNEISDLETFSIGFEDRSYNELPWARQVARKLGSRHFDEVVKGEDPLLLEEISDRLDEPFADTSILPTYLLCRMAKQRVTVALSGDGGDELLAGYVTHVATALQRRLQNFPRPLMQVAEWGIGLLPDSRKKVNWVFKAKQFVRGSSLESWRAHAWWRMLATPTRLAEMFSDGLGGDDSAFASTRVAYEQVPRLGFLDRFLYVDYRTWLVDDILTKVDRASMAHGLEVRSPFLDHRLVEFCAGLPPGLKLRGSSGKVLLRLAARGHVPELAIRRSKSGFNAPVSSWLTHAWKNLFQDTLKQDPGPFKVETVGRLWTEHTLGRRDHGHLLFAALMGMLWLRRVKPSL